MSKFIVGESYRANDIGLDEITVLKRTAKMLIVTNGNSTWRMLIRIDGKGNEYVVDSTVPKRFADCYTYQSNRV